VAIRASKKSSPLSHQKKKTSNAQETLVEVNAANHLELKHARSVSDETPVVNIKQPFAIRVLTWFAALASVGMYLSILLAVRDIGPHMIGGEQVTRSEWLHIAAPLVAVIGILMALIAYGFARQRSWSRHVVIAMFVLIFVYASILGGLNLIHHAIMWRAIINASVFGGASVWYFYFKPNVAAYFRELARRSTG
jgi:hypothetical protein